MMQALFRVDASEHIGSGHLFRCLTLARALRRRGVTVAFATQPLGEQLASLILEEGFPLFRLYAGSGKSGSKNPDYPFGSDLQLADARATLEEAFPENGYGWVIVDHYGLDETWEAVVRPRCERMLVIDDLADRRHVCDILLDQNALVDTESRYRLLVNPDARLLEGPTYALLRDEFVRERQNSSPRNGDIRNLLVSFGGADPTGEAIKTVKALRGIPGFSEGIDVIGGAANARIDELERICRTDLRMTFHSTTSEMARLMSRADLSIGACGTTSWERCALFLPALVTVVAENQQEVARTLSSSGAAHSLGWYQDVSEQDIASAITALNNSPDRVSRMSRLAGTLVDAGGTERVVREMEKIHACARTLH